MKLLKSKAFLTAVFDAVISLILYFVGKYAAPTIFEDVKVVLLALQPIVVALIAAFLSDELSVKVAANVAAQLRMK